MAEIAYVLCCLTSSAVAVLLLRAYSRARVRILLWAGLGFVGLSLNNGLVVLDLLIFQSIDFSGVRDLPAMLGMAVLVAGLIWDAE